MLAPLLLSAAAWSGAAPPALAPRLCMTRAAISMQEDDFSVEYVPPPPPPAQANPGMSPCSIKVVGVGGGGGNTLNRMVQDGPGVERTALTRPNPPCSSRPLSL